METVDGPVRFRILAGAAHSWSTLLLESEPGALFVYQTLTGELELIDRADANQLTTVGVYRPWLGPAAWTSLAELPVTVIARAPVDVPGLESNGLGGDLSPG